MDLVIKLASDIISFLLILIPQFFSIETRLVTNINMIKFTAAALLITTGAAFIGSASAEDPQGHRQLVRNHGQKYMNFRVGEKYSTWSLDGHLTNVNSMFEISPTDSYDFVPTKGYGRVQLARDFLQEILEETPGEENAFGIFKSSEEATKWAKSTLQNEVLRKDLVPMPNDNIIAKELTIDAIEALFVSDDKVLCHEIEVESYFCHRVDKEYNVSIKKVTISISGGKPNNLYVACHYNDGCHVMNDDHDHDGGEGEGEGEGTSGTETATLAQETRDLTSDVDEIPYLTDAIENTTASTWITLLQDHVLSQSYALVIGRPSAELATAMAADERKREDQRVADLGPEKLGELGARLAAAIEVNEREIPEEILTSVPIPSLSKVRTLPVLTMRGVERLIDVAARDVGGGNGGVKEEEVKALRSRLQGSNTIVGGGNDVGAEAYYVDWNHIESAFLYTSVTLSTVDLTPTQRLYPPLLLELAFKLPAKLDDETTLTKDEFVSQLQDDTVSYAAHPGLPGCGTAQ